MRVEVEIGMITVDAAMGMDEPGALRTAIADAVIARLRDAGMPETLGDRRTGQRTGPATQTSALCMQLAAEIVKGIPR